MVQKTQKIRTLKQLREYTLEELLHEVARSRQTVIVVLKGGERVMIRPAIRLKPLPELDGRVSEGWKDAAY